MRCEGVDRLLMTGQQQETPVQFGDQLRAWRSKRELSLAGLAKLVHYSKGYLSKLENGDKPPTPDVARRCDEALGAGGELLRLVPEAPAVPAPRGEPVDVCPYRGLAAFSAEHAGWFFGRERAVAELVEAVAMATGPVVLVAPSGAGKSSLLQAGLLPAIRAGALPAAGSRDWPQVVLHPTATPMNELARVPAGPAVVVVDQFEETFTLCPDPVEREAFITALCALPAVVVLGVRADFYGHLLEHPQLMPSLRENQVVLGPMTDGELRQAVVRPAQAAGLVVEPGLVEVLLRDLGTGGLPLLSHALLTTWQHRNGRVLTVAGYELTGGIRTAVARSAERAYARLSPAAREVARQVLLRMVRVDQEAGATRRALSLAEVADLPSATEVLDEFVAARLVTVAHERAEITHEALLAAWPRLHDWVDADRVGLCTRQRLGEAAGEWKRAGQPRTLLYQGMGLQAAAEWAAVHPGELSTLEQGFLVASRGEQRTRTRRLRLLVALLGVLLLVAGSTTGVIWWQGGQIQRERDVAVSPWIAGMAADVRAKDPSLGMNLGLAAWRTARTREARGAVLSTARPYPTRLTTGQGWVHSVSLSADGRMLAAGNKDGAITLWDISTLRQAGTVPDRTTGDCCAVFSPVAAVLLVSTARGTELWDVADPTRPGLLGSLGAPASAAVFTPDGKTVLAGVGQVVRRWDVSDPRTPVALPDLDGHRALVRALAISDDGSTMLTGDAAGVVLRWRGPEKTPQALPGRNDEVLAVALSPDGQTYAISDTSSATVIGEGDTSTVLTGPGMTSMTWGLDFDPSGKYLVSGGNESGATVWEVTTRKRATSFGSPYRVLGVMFGKGASLLVSSSEQGAVYLRRDPLAALTAHRGGIDYLALNRVKEIAVTSTDSETLVWRLSADGRREHLGTAEGEGRVNEAAVSPDGRMFAVVRQDGTADLWDIEDPRRPLLARRWQVSASSMAAVTFSPDGRTLVTGDNGNRAQVWAIDEKQPRFAGEAKAKFRNVNAISFHPGGKVMATADTNGFVRVWNMEDRTAPKLRWEEGAHTSAATDVQYSPDGSKLVSTGYDGKVRLWNVADGRPVGDAQTLTGHTSVVWWADFSPDNRSLVTYGSDGANRLWSVTDGTQQAALKDIGSARFTADSRHLVTISGATLQTLDTDPDTVVREICAVAGGPLTDAERTLYLNGADRPTCGPS